MGKPTPEQSSEKPSTTHFSHPHPLQLSNIQPLAQILHCSACHLAATGAAYTCTANCNFILHAHCHQLPPQIKHSFDRLNHDLFLLPKPIYPEGLFRCDGCGNHGGGFSYHCSPCGIDLHTTCATLPMRLAHQSHHHELTLSFAAPYAGNEFSCDICKRVGSKTWIYRCGVCDFDVHLTCVAAVVPAQAPHVAQQAPPQVVQTISTVFPPQPAVYPPNVGGYGVSRPPPPQVVMGQAQNAQVVGTPYAATMGVPQKYGAPPSRPAGGLGDQLMVAAVNGVASGVAQSATGAIIQGVFGGGGGGGGGAQIDGGCGGGDAGYGGGELQYYEEPSYYVE